MVELYKELFEKNDLLGYLLKPNITINQVDDEFKVTIKTNSYGLRNDIDYSKGNHPSIKRILGLGDSFTFGHGVNIEETYLKILERELNFKSAWKYEVINGGIWGWGIAQELLFLKHIGIRYMPDIVIVGFIDDDLFRNDRYYHKVFQKEFLNREGVQAGVRPAYSLLFRVKDYLLHHTRTYPFLASKVAQIPWFDGLLYRTGMREKGNEFFRNADYMKQSLPMGKKIFLEFKKICSENNIELIVVNIPVDYKKTKSSNQIINQINDEMINYLSANGIPVFDLRPAFDSNELLCYARDKHLNAAGHKMIAMELYNFLKNTSRIGG